MTVHTGSKLMRVFTETFLRAEKILEPMQEKHAVELMGATNQSATTVVRVAIALGLNELEKKYAKDEK
jgi:hypothetical protein